MKISVITLQNVANYGSVLQTYATQSILENMGYEVEFINYTRENQLEKNVRRCKMDYSSLGKFIKSTYRVYVQGMLISRKKRRVFSEFVKKNIHSTADKYFSIEALRKHPPQADIYCTGSDQMWNSSWNGGVEHSYYLDFIEDKPKFAFSTSIGMTEFPESEVPEIVGLLQKYDFITVREKTAADLLGKYNISAKTVLDPTLMLNGDFWCEFAKMKNNKIETGYILVYQLNPQHKSVDFTNYVKQLSQKMGLPVVAITYGLKVKRVFDEYICLPTMEKFVSLFTNASYVVTDSFHGTSFCINLNKPLTVIYPPQYSSRLVNILQLCGLTDRVYTGSENDIYLREINYGKVNIIMQRVREESLKVIEDGLTSICIC